MASVRDDLVDLSDYVYNRLRARMEGLTDDEYRWEPAKDFSLTWRLGHSTDLLREERVGSWLGQDPPPGEHVGEHAGAEAALLRDLYGSLQN
jgi:hypothetical protein